MLQLVRPSISASPVSKAFSFIEWTPPTIAISRPEQGLMKSAEENPLEYIIADYQESYAYARLLLKVLDQVTGPSNPGRVSELRLEDDGLEDEEALQYLEDDKMGVVTHYLIAKLYDFIGLLTEQSTQSPVQLSTVFYQEDKLLEDWRPLLRILYRQGDPFSQRGAALSLMYILIAGCPRQQNARKITMVEETLQSLVSWLTSRLQSSYSTSLGVVTPTLVVLGTCPPARTYFNAAGGIGYLSRHLRPKKGVIRRSIVAASASPTGSSSSARTTSTSGSAMRKISSGSHINGYYSVGTTSSTGSSKPRTPSAGIYSSAQQTYELCFCLWTMAYDCVDNESMKHHFARDGAVAALAELIAAAPREKVIRLALNSLRHLAQLDAKLFVPEMIACRVLKSIDLLNEQKQWTDPDMTEDIDALHKILSDNYQELTKWEVYQAELESGSLKDGILHTEHFFKANARKMEGMNGDFCHVKRLIQLITRREDEETVAMAVFDLGEFARHYPSGKSIANRLGAKQVVMPLLGDHESGQIQRQALLCISKMLVNNWQAVVSS